MNAQSLVVTLLVVVAALYATWRLVPARWRATARRRLGLPPAAPPPGACADCAEADAHRRPRA